jgi:hypothetical protein
VNELLVGYARDQQSNKISLHSATACTRSVSVMIPSTLITASQAAIGTDPVCG